jgi:phosphinothricin acetyltransferase
MKIRLAVLTDVPDILKIYNYEVLHGVATLDLHPKTLEEQTQWFYAHMLENRTLLAAVDEGKVVGYASLSAYREKEAFQSTVELSVYVRLENRHQGIASALMKEILKKAQDNPQIHTVISVITSGNNTSVQLHKKFGFEYCGTIREVGVKFGQYQDIENYSLHV